MSEKDTNQQSVQIYSYGCLPPTEGSDALRDQLYRARKYQNALVELELKRRARYREIRSRLCPDLAGFEAQRDQITAEIDALKNQILTRRKAENAAALRGTDREKRKSARGVHPKYPELEAQIAHLKAQRKVLSPRITEERAKFDEPCAVAREAAKHRQAEMCERTGKSGPVAKAAFNALIFGEMLSEPQWSPAWKEVAQADAEALATHKALRAASGLYAGTYMLVERAMDAAKSGAEDPRFRRFDGTGRVGVQLSDGGLSVEQLRAGGSRELRLSEPRPVEGRGGKPCPVVQIRIGTDAARHPIWAAFPVVLHRPVPEDAVVKWAWILVRRRGRKFDYSLQLTLERHAQRHVDSSAQGAVALHLAWRKTEDWGEREIRVGYVVGSDGHREPITVPAEIRETLKHADVLRSASDQHFDDARAALAAAIGRGTFPAWVAHECATLAQWRDHGRLHRVSKFLCAGYPGSRPGADGSVAHLPEAAVISGARCLELWRAWRDAHIGPKPAGVAWSQYRTFPRHDLLASPDEVDRWLCAQGVATEVERAAAYLDFWRRKDDHLTQWQASARSRALAARKDLYRRVANHLARRYRDLVVDDTKLSLLVRRAPAEGVDATHAAARSQRFDAAPGELRLIMRERFGKVRTVVVDAAGSAQICCEHGGTFRCEDTEISGTCDAGCRRDRDENAARNLLSRAGFGGNSEGSTDTGDLGTPRDDRNENDHEALPI